MVRQRRKGNGLPILPVFEVAVQGQPKSHRSTEDSAEVRGREDGLEWATETICLAHLLSCHRFYMVLGKGSLNGLTTARANGEAVVQIHVW